MYDLVVVGAGPAGLVCAERVAKEGKSVLVVEKDEVVGEPVSCGGLFSKTGLKKLDIKPKKSFTRNKVKGARFYSKNQMAEIGKGRERAFVVDRAEFDRELAKKYEKHGELILGTKCLDISRKTDSINVLLEDGSTMKTKNLALATGPSVFLRNKLGFEPKNGHISAVQYEIETDDVDKDFVELYNGSVAPGFFAWVIPVDKKTLRVGLGTIDAPKKSMEYFEEFLKDFGDFEVISTGGGVIPLYDPQMPVRKENIYLLGDAATHVKATTGGGVILGCMAARTLAECLLNRKDYEGELQAIKKELKKHLMVRRFVNRFNDRKYDELVSLLKNRDLRELLEEHGDMDLIGPFSKELVKRPSLLVGAGYLFVRSLF